MTQKITVDELRTHLESVRGNTFATIVAETLPKVPKGCPYPGLRKLSQVNVAIGFNYENSVNRQRDREGIEEAFEAQPRQWGTRINGTPLVEHTNKDGVHRLYLETKIQKTLGHQYRDAEGNDLADEDVEEFLRAPSKPATQGTAKEVMVRDYGLDSIVEITLLGETYAIIREA